MSGVVVLNKYVDNVVRLMTKNEFRIPIGFRFARIFRRYFVVCSVSVTIKIIPTLLSTVKRISTIDVQIF